MEKSLQPENKNRVLAGISYLLLLSGIFGIIIDTIIYYTTKNKYARFHSGQAIWLMIAFLILGILIIGPTALASTYGPIDAISILEIGIVYSYLKIGVILVVSVLAFMGKDFRIPIAARLLEK